MSHPYPPVNPTTVWLVLAGLLVVIVIFFAFAGAVVRLATKLVAGFSPTWGRAIGAIICAILLTLFADFVFLLMLWPNLNTPNTGLILLLVPLGYFTQSVCYMLILRGDGEESVSLGQAFMIVLMQSVLSLLFGFVIAMAFAFTGIFAKARLDSLRALQNHRLPFILPARSSQAHASVADAQKEAVRRYPQLAVNGSRINKAYVERYRLYQKTNPAYFSDPSWPLKLADEVANDPSAR